MSEFQTKPNPDHPDRCPSIDPHDDLQCGRRIHDDDQCQFDGIGWKKGSPRHVSDAEKVVALIERVRVAETKVALLLCERHQAGSPTRQPCAACSQDARAALTTPTPESGTDEGSAP